MSSFVVEAIESLEVETAAIHDIEGARLRQQHIEHVDVQIWPADNERTSPIIQGNIQVRP